MDRLPAANCSTDTSFVLYQFYHNHYLSHHYRSYPSTDQANVFVSRDRDQPRLAIARFRGRRQSRVDQFLPRLPFRSFLCTRGCRTLTTVRTNTLTINVFTQVVFTESVPPELFRASEYDLSVGGSSRFPSRCRHTPSSAGPIVQHHWT